VATIEGYTMIGASALISVVADRRKNFNKLLLVGAFVYMAAMFIQGPVNIIHPDRKHGVYWVAAGVALGGVGQAFINVNSMAALEESIRGVWPSNKMIEVNNAMGAVISGANGAGNFSGVIIGSFIFTIYSTANCLKLPSKGFQTTLSDKCSIDGMWNANIAGFHNFQHFDTQTYEQSQIPNVCFMACVNNEPSDTIFVPVDYLGWQTAFTYGLAAVTFCTALQLISVLFYQNPNLTWNKETNEKE
jgi:hypothetical protein